MVGAGFEVAVRMLDRDPPDVDGAVEFVTRHLPRGPQFLDSTASVPTFCRHGRLEANCPICSKKRSPRRRGARPAAGGPPRSGRRRTRRRSARGRATCTCAAMARAQDDGYESWAVPGLRATVEAAAAGRRDRVRRGAPRRSSQSDPPGLYADAATRRRRGGPVARVPDRLPVAGGGRRPVRRHRARHGRPWATGELPDLDGVPLGPRAGHDPARGLATLTAYRARAERAGSQAAALAAGEPSLNPQRRFDRAFERLSLPGPAPRAALRVPRHGRRARPARRRAVVAAASAPTRPIRRCVAAKRDPRHRRRDQPPAPRERAGRPRPAVPIAALDLGVPELGAPRGRPDHRGLDRAAGPRGARAASPRVLGVS